MAPKLELRLRMRPRPFLPMRLPQLHLPTTQSDEPHIPRPSNCFFIFRSEFLSLDGKFLSREQTKASISAAAAWKELPEKRKAHYRDLARRRKEEHARKHPGYKYSPRRSKGGKKAHGRMKINASQTQISLDAQRFCHAPPSSVPTAPEVLQSTVQVSSPISEPTQPFMANGNEKEISPIQAMYLAPSLYHPTPPASLPSVELDTLQTGGSAL
ncbi:uncharacterized protein EV420DRAFT_1315067 [Desarmillaria tabescens]|uniref:HMG box domain-containing protein n=1 Tax=Armillaria tabescens TaxID=1929756 RepID=A0AA39JHY2_ARMTA|nr:uncharacterized protein EV420DRAFT_1315067 [Desarmillaria tabescens]KAK0443091.1 hypothetical protein EV420DRAFT_1315067 [Desarmillaria tabescens]